MKTTELIYVTPKVPIEGHYDYALMRIQNNTIIEAVFANEIGKLAIKDLTQPTFESLWDLPLTNNQLPEDGLIIFTRETHPEYFI